MSIGKCDARQILTAVRRLCGQFSTGPRRVFDQSIERISAPMSPPSANTPSAVGAFTCSDKPSILFLIFLKKYLDYGSRSEEVSQAEPFTTLRIYPTQPFTQLSNPAIYLTQPVRPRGALDKYTVSEYNM